jgi:hypothetical protein
MFTRPMCDCLLLDLCKRCLNNIEGAGCRGKQGRQSSDEKTITANLGLAIDDMTVAPLVFERAKHMKIVRWWPLLWRNEPLTKTIKTLS